jgi:7,8-dihydro-6-hydroxymethylpterin-pyrophosphokinase
LRDAADVTSSANADAARAELLQEALVELRLRASRYVQEPADDAWDDFVNALARTHGDSDAYDLLRAIEIRVRTSSRR